jgi:carboxymethylenebutenolidase
MRAASKGVAVSAAVCRLSCAPKTQMVTFRSDSEEISGFLALPADPGRRPAVLVIHEWWGLNGWVKEQATNLARHGYVVLAADLYRGKVTTDRSEARKLKRELKEDRAIRDLQAGFDYLADRQDVDPARIGSMGWSMGGCLALQLAIHEPRLAACIVNYGSLPTALDDIQKINVQVLGNFGSLDRGVPPDKVRAFEARMKADKKAVDFKIYNGAGHGFENPATKRGYRPKDASDAWLRTLAFLGHALARPNAY